MKNICVTSAKMNTLLEGPETYQALETTVKTYLHPRDYSIHCFYPVPKKRRLC
jgi:hypothetical protein